MPKKKLEKMVKKKKSVATYNISSFKADFFFFFLVDIMCYNLQLIR